MPPDLRGCFLSDAEYDGCSGFASCEHLEELHLEATAWATALSSRSPAPGHPPAELRPRGELDIGKRRMGTREESRRAVASADLKGALSDDGVSAVADAAEIPSLEEVTSGNDVGIEGALALVEVSGRPWTPRTV